MARFTRSFAFALLFAISFAVSVSGWAQSFATDRTSRGTESVSPHGLASHTHLAAATCQDGSTCEGDFHEGQPSVECCVGVCHVGIPETSPPVTKLDAGRNFHRPFRAHVLKNQGEPKFLRPPKSAGSLVG